jgi:hypothetical protein
MASVHSVDRLDCLIVIPNPHLREIASEMHHELRGVGWGCSSSMLVKSQPVATMSAGRRSMRFVPQAVMMVGRGGLVESRRAGMDLSGTNVVPRAKGSGESVAAPDAGENRYRQLLGFRGGMLGLVESASGGPRRWGLQRCRGVGEFVGARDAGEDREGLL